MNITDKITLTREDNMEMMSRYQDGYFDLAIVDPPYGIGEDWKKRNKGEKYIDTTYDNSSIPTKEYFQELFRVSKNQIIWGYNYFTEHLGPTNYLICWDKMSNNNEVFMYSNFELAYTSFKTPARLYSFPWDGYRMGNETGKKKIHPHQKPVSLYKWLLDKYAKKGDRILDTHTGSASIAIACHDYGFELTGCEIDITNYEKSIDRIKKHVNQTNLFLS